MARNKADQAAANIRDAYQVARNKSWAVEQAIKDERIPEEVFDDRLDDLDHALDDLAATIARNTGGAISLEEADHMVRFRFDEIGLLIDRLAV